MKIILRDNNEEINLSNEIFNIKFNKTLIHQVYTSYLSNLRKNIKFNKNRSNVSFSGKKPWKQKGTGRSRSGSFSSPIWRTGGVTFGSQIRNYTCKINKKMYKLACKSAISKLFYQNRILVFKEFNLNKISTKILYEKIYKICNKDKTLILIDKYDKILIKSSNNIYFLEVKCISNINIISIIGYKKIILTLETIESIKKLLL